MSNALLDNIIADVRDDNQREYRDFFNIKDKFLIHCHINDDKKTGYIVFIDYDNDLDYIDKREHKDWSDDENLKFSRYIAKLQIAEATPHLNLSEEQIMAFKRKLGGGYILALERNFDGIDNVIEDALTFLRQRNIETARTKILESAGVITALLVVAGIALYLSENDNKWCYGILFGVLGAYTSIWTRYGRMTMTGLATIWLHYLESVSRLFVGSVFGVVAMFAIKCGIILSDIGQDVEIYAYSLTSFAAGFSERFIPSLIEKIVNEKVIDNETTNHNN